MREIIKFITFIKKHKGKIAVGLIAVILMLGMYGNYIALLKDTGNHDSIYGESFFKAITLLGLNVPDKVNIYNSIGFGLAVILVYASFFLLAFNSVLNNWFFKLFLKDDNIILFGFGEINKNFLENFRKDRDDNVIVVDKEEIDFDDFWEEGYIFLKKDINETLIDKFDFEKTSDIVVAIGNDRINIDVALKLIDKLKDVKTITKLIVHINDNEISDVFFEKLEEIAIEKLQKQIKFFHKKIHIICTKPFSNIKTPQLFINLKVFSLNTEIVDNLFDNYTTKLVPYEYAKLNSDKKELKLIVIGNSKVNLEIIKRIFVNFIFPNEVKTRIFLVDENEKKFKENIEFHTNFDKQKFPHIILESKKLTYDLLKNKSFWLQEDLVDIIIAFDNEDKNLEIAIDLFEKVFVHQDKSLKYPNIFFAMYEELAFSNYINQNKNNFKNFFTFGNIKEILSVKNLLDDEKFEGAKQIHYGYGTKYDKDKIEKNKDKLNSKWFSSKHSDKLSNIAQYEHMPYKLLSLGLYKEKKIDKKTLLKDNQKILFSKLKQFNMPSEEEIFRFSCEVESSYNEKVNYKFDKKIVNEFFEIFVNSKDFYKLINTEHKRWMAYHYLNGWEYSDKKDKSKKLHNCLVELKDFNDEQRKMTVIYDIYSYLYLPNYLTAGEYKIKP